MYMYKNNVYVYIIRYITQDHATSIFAGQDWDIEGIGSLKKLIFLKIYVTQTKTLCLTL